MFFINKLTYQFNFLVFLFYFEEVVFLVKIFFTQQNETHDIVYTPQIILLHTKQWLDKRNKILTINYKTWE